MPATAPTLPTAVRFPTLRVLLHRDTETDAWVAQGIDCDLAAQADDPVLALAGIQRQVAACAWLRMASLQLPPAGPIAIRQAWDEAKTASCAIPTDPCLLHLPGQGLCEVHAPLQVRRSAAAPPRLGTLRRAPRREELLQQLAARRRTVREQTVRLLGGWGRPGPLLLLAIGARRFRPIELPADAPRIARMVAGCLLRA